MNKLVPPERIPMNFTKYTIDYCMDMQKYYFKCINKKDITTKEMDECNNIKRILFRCYKQYI